MKTNQSIVSKITIASLAVMMVAGSSFSWAAERPHRDGDSDKGPRNHRLEQREHQNHDGERENRGMRGGPRVENRRSGDHPFQGRRMGNRPSPHQSDQKSNSIRQKRGPQRIGEQQGRQGPVAFRQRAMRGQHAGNLNAPSFRHPGSFSQNRGNMGASRFRGRMMSQEGIGNIQKRRFGRAMAMRQMALRFRGEGGHPFMGGQRFRDHHRGPDAGEGKSHFKQGSHRAKGKGRHQEMRGRKGKGPKQSALKNRGHKKDRSGKNNKGIQKRRGDKKEGKAKGKNPRRNRNRHS
jgi:hypothetical protein